MNVAALRSVPSPRTETALERACLCARVAADLKARDVVVLDMRELTPLYDFFILATGISRRQIHTLAEEIDNALRAEGESCTCSTRRRGATTPWKNSGRTRCESTGNDTRIFDFGF